ALPICPPRRGDLRRRLPRRRSGLRPPGRRGRRRRGRPGLPRRVRPLRRRALRRDPTRDRPPAAHLGLLGARRPAGDLWGRQRELGAARGVGRRPRERGAGGRRITLLGLLAGLALAGVGCADYVGDDLRAGDYPRHDLLTFEEVAAEADALDQPREPVPTDPRELDVGDCFDDLAAPPVRGFEWARQVDLVPCRLPHRYELFARVPLTDGEGEPWPGASVA